MTELKHGGRKRYHHGDLRRAVIEAAFAKLCSDRSDRLSLRSLAAEVGVSPMAVYRHFADIDTLMAVVAARGFDMLGAALMSVRGAEADPRSLCSAYIDFALAYPAVYRFIFTQNHFGTAIDDELRDASFAAFDILVGSIAVHLSAERVTNARSLAHTVWAALHGAVQLASVSLIPVGAAGDAERREEMLRTIGDNILKLGW